MYTLSAFGYRVAFCLSHVAVSSLDEDMTSTGMMMRRVRAWTQTRNRRLNLDDIMIVIVEMIYRVIM